MNSGFRGLCELSNANNAVQSLHASAARRSRLFDWSVPDGASVLYTGVINGVARLYRRPQFRMEAIVSQSSPLPNLAPEHTREIAAEFSNRAGFESAVRQLIAAGLDRTDISVLATHDSLEIAGPIAGYDAASETENMATVLHLELPWLGPLAIAGALLAVTGPVGLAVAGIVGAAAGVVALGPVLSEVTESVHAERFSEAIQQGRILLWVRIANEGALDSAERVIIATGGTHLTRLAHARPEAETAQLP